MLLNPVLFGLAGRLPRRRRRQ